MKMKLAVVVWVSVITVSIVVPLTSGEHRVGQDPCRVAVAVSGDVRSFVDPGVHRSFRRHVVESIKKNGCQVDVFAYAMLKDGMDFLLGEEVRRFAAVYFAPWVHPATAVDMKQRLS